MVDKLQKYGFDLKLTNRTRMMQIVQDAGGFYLCFSGNLFNLCSNSLPTFAYGFHCMV